MTSAGSAAPRPEHLNEAGAVGPRRTISPHRGGQPVTAGNAPAGGAGRPATASAASARPPASPALSPALEPLVARLAQLRAGQSASVTLDPERLGAVTVRFVRRHGRWQVHLVAERGEAAALLARGLPRLAASLEHSFEGAQIDVQVGGQGDQASAEGQDGQEAAPDPTSRPAPSAAAPGRRPKAAPAEPLPAPSPDRLDLLT